LHQKILKSYSLYISSKNRKGRRFKCLNCGFEEDADVVAGMNLSFLAIPPPIEMGGPLAR